MLMGLSGCFLLVLGRKLFWLFVALVGMVAGIQLAEQYFFLKPYWQILLIGLAAAVIGALLAIFFQKVAVAVAGFLAGGAVVHHFMTFLGWPAMPVAVFIAGIIGALLLFWLFDWGLIVLSSVAGATLIVNAWYGWPHGGLVLYAGLILAGVLIQTLIMVGSRPTPKRG